MFKHKLPQRPEIRRRANRCALAALLVAWGSSSAMSADDNAPHGPATDAVNIRLLPPLPVGIGRMENGAGSPTANAAAENASNIRWNPHFRNAHPESHVVPVAGEQAIIPATQINAAPPVQLRPAASKLTLRPVEPLALEAAVDAPLRLATPIVPPHAAAPAGTVATAAADPVATSAPATRFHFTDRASSDRLPAAAIEQRNDSVSVALSDGPVPVSTAPRPRILVATPPVLHVPKAEPAPATDAETAAADPKTTTATPAPSPDGLAPVHKTDLPRPTTADTPAVAKKDASESRGAAASANGREHSAGTKRERRDSLSRARGPADQTGKNGSAKHQVAAPRAATPNAAGHSNATGQKAVSGFQLPVPQPPEDNAVEHAPIVVAQSSIAIGTENSGGETVRAVVEHSAPKIVRPSKPLVIEVPKIQPTAAAAVDEPKEEPKTAQAAEVEAKIVFANPATEALVVNTAETRSLAPSQAVRKVQLEDREICDAVLVGPHKLLLIGRSEGKTRLAVWCQDQSEPTVYELQVVAATQTQSGSSLEGIASRLTETIAANYPTCRVSVTPDGDGLTVRGTATDERSAREILRLVRTACLKSISDELIVR